MIYFNSITNFEKIKKRFSFNIFLFEIQVLSKIWAIAANKKRELNRDDFYVACRAVALAQRGIVVNNENMMAYKGMYLP